MLAAMRAQGIEAGVSVCAWDWLRTRMTILVYHEGKARAVGVVLPYYWDRARG
jgi:hypothetical protein